MNGQQPSAPARRIRYVPALDGLRGVSLPGTIYTHFQIFLGYLPTAPGWVEHSGPFTLNIEMFFTLSGALITSLLVSEHQRSGQVSLQSFYLRRSRRLGPALLAVFPLLLVARYLLPGTSGIPPFGTTGWITVVTVLLFVGNWRLSGHTAGLGWLGPAWTLGIEEQFYLTWPTLLWLSMRRGWARRTTLLALGAAVAVATAIGAELYRHYGWGKAVYLTPTEVSPILMGCALGYALTTSPEGRLARLLRSPLVALVGLTGMVVLSAEGYDRIRILAYGGLAMYGGFACLLIGHCLAADRPSLVTRFFGWKPFVIIGQISYEAYLVHLMVILAVLQVAPHLPVNDMILVDLAIIAAISAAFYYFVEDPIRRRGWKVLLRRAQARPVVEPPAAGRRLRPGLVAGVAVGLAAVIAVTAVVVDVHRHGSQPVAFASQTAGNGVGAGPGEVGPGGAGTVPTAPVRAPIVSALAPASGPIAGGTVVTITGTGFTKAATVQFGSVPLHQVKWVSGQIMLVRAPSAEAIENGPGNPRTELHGLVVAVTVTTAAGTSEHSTSSRFTYR